MALIVEANRPYFSESSLHCLKHKYQLPLEEVIAIGLESYRLNDAEGFFKNSIIVVLCSGDAEECDSKITKAFVERLWKEFNPWLIAAYRICPQLRHAVVHHVDVTNTSIRISAYEDRL